jgi:hypothetical protein
MQAVNCARHYRRQMLPKLLREMSEMSETGLGVE